MNVAFSRQPTRLGALDKTPEIDLETMDEDTIFGAGKIEHLTWKQLLDLISLHRVRTLPGPVSGMGPGKPLSPKLVDHGPRLRVSCVGGHNEVEDGRGACPQLIDD